MRWISLLFATCLPACTGLSWDTTLAETRETRFAMLQSVEIGRTTEGQFTARWGQPTQRIREGGQTELVYRRIRDQPFRMPQVGVSDRFVIVTFQYGKAVAARSNDTELCRAIFPPRPPGFGYSTPAIIRPIGTCPGTAGGPPGTTSPGGGAPDGQGGSDGAATLGPPGANSDRLPGFWRPGVPEDRYQVGKTPG